MTEGVGLAELARVELERVQKKLNYAEKLLSETKALFEIIEELLRNEKKTIEL